MIFNSKLSPEKIFTPKGAIVNDDMYIHRNALESALERAIRKLKHIIIHGESSTGKTWLYKKVFKDNDVYYEVLNSASIKTAGSV